jgi:RNA polymerase sigma factor (sigma-70 family)
MIEQSWHEPEVFAVLYDRHASYLHRYVTRRLGHSVADDVVADTFLAAFQRRRRYDLGRADARPWLYRIAADVIGKHRRTELRQLRAFARTGADPVAETYTDQVDTRVSAAAAQRDLAAALSELGAKYREVLLLIAWADLSYEEVAGEREGDRRGPGLGDLPPSWNPPAAPGSDTLNRCAWGSSVRLRSWQRQEAWTPGVPGCARC